MRIDLIGHASLLVRSGELALLTDPWWAGPAYEGQWFPYPFPVPERYDLGRLDVLYLSHGREDHLHAPTLRELRRQLTVVIPRSFDPGNCETLQAIGFGDIEEIAGGDSFVVQKGRSEMRLTVLTYLGDSILAVEADGQVLLDLNDALHGARREVAAEYCRILKARFPRIDYLFGGFGGAGYFPNCFRLPGKDDLAVARRREEALARNLAWIARQLRPRQLFPFASHFVLPDEHNWWISELRLNLPGPRERLRDELVAPGVELHDLEPGDHIEDGRVENVAPSRRDPEEVRRVVRARYPVDPPRPLSDDDFDALVARLRARAAAAPRNDVELNALIRLWDHPERAIRVDAARVSVVDGQRGNDAPLVMETRAPILRRAIEDEFGRDLICRGYGAILHFRSRAGLRASLHEALLDRITRFPTWRSRVEQHPVMCLSYLWRDPGARLAARRRIDLAGAALARLGLRPAAPRDRLYALDEWC